MKEFINKTDIKFVFLMFMIFLLCCIFAYMGVSIGYGIGYGSPVKGQTLSAFCLWISIASTGTGYFIMWLTALIVEATFWCLKCIKNKFTKVEVAP